MVHTVYSVRTSNTIFGSGDCRYERDIMANVTNGSGDTVRSLRYSNAIEGSGFLIAETTIGITHIAIVFANLTDEGVYTIAIENNSLLNAKFSVFVIAQDSIIINGVHMENGEVQSWTSPFPAVLGITHNGSYYQIRLKQIDSIDDIEDSDRPVNMTAEYNSYDLMSVAISGIPAVLASLAVNIAVLVFIKSQKVQEGLPNDI